MKTKTYETQLNELREELAEVQRWLLRTGNRLLVIFEGRDTAGKGSTIHAITRRLNPRHVRTVALTKPSEREQTEWYFQRHLKHLPAAGEMVLFDRSWYNRAGVESVMNFATEQQVQEFLQNVPKLESLLVNDGIILRKYWLSCSQKEQEERFAERASNPLKRHKLSPIDIQARQKYDDYTRARNRMFAATHTEDAPWTVIDYNSQKRGRLNLIRHLIDSLPNTDVDVPEVTLPKLNRPLGEPDLIEPWLPVPDRFE